MADRADELRATAAECLALSRSTIDPQTRTALLTMAQKLYDMASDDPRAFEAVVQEFNDQQMLPRVKPQQPQPTMQQQQQIQPKKKKSSTLVLLEGNTASAPAQRRGRPSCRLLLLFLDQ